MNTVDLVADISYVIQRLSSETKKCSECGKDNPFSGAKAGCKKCKQVIKDTAKEVEADRSGINKSNRISKQRVASAFKRLYTRTNPIKRMAVSTHLELDVTDEKEYDRMMNLLNR